MKLTKKLLLFSFPFLLLNNAIQADTYVYDRYQNVRTIYKVTPTETGTTWTQITTSPHSYNDAEFNFYDQNLNQIFSYNYGSQQYHVFDIDSSTWSIQSSDDIPDDVLYPHVMATTNVPSAITTNTSNISTNTSNISTNTSNISTNTSAIESLQSSNASSINTNSTKINTNTDNINKLGEGVAGSTALTAALTALPQTSKDTKLSCGIGTGAYSSKYAVGFGCASKISERVDINAGGSYVFGGSKSYGGGTLDSGVVKAGFVFKLGELNKPTKISLNESKELKKEIYDLKVKNDEIISQNQKLLARLEKVENIALKFKGNKDEISMSK